jgi:hypothetical protein
MNIDANPQRYRKLSVTSLITGILTYSFILLMLLILLKMAYVNDITNIIILFTVFGLAIAAITCGSIDLKTIKSGHSSKKGKGLDISGIVLGSVFILADIIIVVWNLLIFPRIF